MVIVWSRDVPVLFGQRRASSSNLMPFSTLIFAAWILNMWLRPWKREDEQIVGFPSLPSSLPLLPSFLHSSKSFPETQYSRSQCETPSQNLPLTPRTLKAHTGQEFIRKHNFYRQIFIITVLPCLPVQNVLVMVHYNRKYTKYKRKRSQVIDEVCVKMFLNYWQWK